MKNNLPKRLSLFFFVFLFVIVFASFIFRFNKYGVTALSVMPTLSVKAVDATGNTLTTVPQGGTLKWVVSYKDLGVNELTSDYFSIVNKNIQNNHTLVTNSLVADTDLTKNYSQDNGITYSTTESGNVNAIKVEGTTSTSTSVAGLVYPPVEHFYTQVGGAVGLRPIVWREKNGSGVYTGNGKMCQIYRHWYPATIFCYDINTGQAIPGYPHSIAATIGGSDYILNTTDKVETFVIADRVYFPAVSTSNDMGIGCWDLVTNSSCGYTQIFNNTAIACHDCNVAMQPSSDYAQGALSIDNNRLCVTAAEANNSYGGLKCYTFSISSSRDMVLNVIPEYSAPNGIIVSSTQVGNALPVSPGWNSDLVLIVADRAFVKYNIAAPNKLFCYKLFGGVPCDVGSVGDPSVWPITTTTWADSLGVHYNLSLQDGVCEFGANRTSPTCYGYYGQVLSSPIVDSNLTHTMGTPTYMDYSKIYVANSTNGVVSCWDYYHSMPCQGFIDPVVHDRFGSIVETFDTGYTLDPYNGCMFGLDETGTFFNFDPYTGQSPCTHSTGQLELTNPKLNYYCDGLNHTLTWDKVKIENFPTGASMFFDVWDSNTNAHLLMGQQFVYTASSGYVGDISSINYTDHPSLTVKFYIDATGEAWTSPVRVELYFTGDAPQMCYSTKVADTCGLNSLTNEAQAYLNGNTLITNSNQVTLSIADSVTCPKPAIGVSNKIISNSSNVDGSFNTTYQVDIKNIGGINLTDVQLQYNLVSQFISPASYSVQSLLSSNLVLNNNYNGSGDVNLLASTGNTLNIGEQKSILLTIRVLPEYNKVYYTQVLASAKSVDTGVVVSDQSDDTTSVGGNGYGIALSGHSVIDPNSNGDATEASENVLTPIIYLKGSVSLLKKIVTSVYNPSNKSYDITYEFKVKNTGVVALNSLQITDDFSTVFHLPAKINRILTLSSSAGLKTNVLYNGITDSNLIEAAKLAPGQVETVKLVVNVGGLVSKNKYYNQATVKAVTVLGDNVMDLSDDNVKQDNFDPNQNGYSNEISENVQSVFTPYIELPKTGGWTIYDMVANILK